MLLALPCFISLGCPFIIHHMYIIAHTTPQFPPSIPFWCFIIGKGLLFSQQLLMTAIGATTQ